MVLYGGDTGGALHFDGVVLVTQAASGPVTIEGLSLAVDPGGITVTSHQEGERTILWNNVTAVLWGTQMTMANGSTAWVLDVLAGSGSTRFLVPAGSVSPDDVESIGRQIEMFRIHSTAQPGAVLPEVALPGGSQPGAVLPGGSPVSLQGAPPPPPPQAPQPCQSWWSITTPAIQ